MNASVLKDFPIGESVHQYIIKQCGFKPHPYLDKADIVCIGYGTTVYPGSNNNWHVTASDAAIPEDMGWHMWLAEHEQMRRQLNHFITSEINQNQFDALFLLMRRVGVTRFIDNGIVQAVNMDPNNQEVIRDRWLRDIYSGRKAVKRLVTAANFELELYFKK